MNEQKILNALLRENLNAFIRKTFDTVSAGDTYSGNWHLHAIAYHLMLCAQGDIRRLIITLPPRSLKSISASVAFPAWLLGHDPTRKIICVSYSYDLAVKHSIDTRVVMESEWYQRCFPHAQLNPSKNTQHEFMTKKLGYRLATSVGGTLTGRGGNLIIIDDPHKSDEVESDTKRENVITWYRNTLVSRLNDKQKDVIIVIQQRLHEDDLAGHLLAAGGWTHLNLPAIAEDAESILVGDGQYHHREEGEALHPEKEPIESLAQMKQDMGSYAFAAQYQQRPAPLGGGIIKWAWFKHRYAQIPVKQEGDWVIQSWDTASSTGQMNDYSVCTTWLIRNGNCYLLDVLRERLEFPRLRQTVVNHGITWRADMIIIENANAGMGLIQDLQTNCHTLQIKGMTPKGDKSTRMIQVTPILETGKVILPKDAPWLPEFQSELVHFPNGKFDDQVDSLSQFLEWFRHRQLGPNILQSRITFIPDAFGHSLPEICSPGLNIMDIMDSPFSGAL